MKSEDLDFVHKPLHKYTEEKDSLSEHIIVVSSMTDRFPTYTIKTNRLDTKPVPKWIGGLQDGETSS